MQLLQGAACLHDVGVVLQLLRRLAKQGLHLEVLLEIEVAQLDIYLHKVVETLLILLVVLPNLLCLGCGYGTDGLPLRLQVAHLLQVVHHVGGLRLCHRLHLLKDILLAQQVLCLFFLYFLLMLSAFLLVRVQQFAELLLHRIHRRLPVLRRLARLGGLLLCGFLQGFLLLMILTVELILQLFHLLFDLCYILLQQFL